MAGITPIRISKNDRKEYNKLVTSARRKVKRLQDKFGIDLAEEINVGKITRFETRKEYNAWKEKATDFTNRYNIEYQYEKNRYGVVMDKKTRRKIEADTRKAQYLHDDRVKKFKDKAIGDGRTVQDRIDITSESAVIGSHRPKGFNFENVRNADRLATIGKNLAKKADRSAFAQTDWQLKQNFMTALRGSFNSESDELVALIEQVPDDDFYELFLQGGRDFNFAVYDSDGQDVYADLRSLKRITGYMKDYFEGQVDMGLQDF